MKPRTSRRGDGNVAETGHLLAAAYRGFIYDDDAADNRGREFAAATAEDPFVFRLGVGQVVSGVDQGVAGMRVGGIRRIVIPPDDGWGTTGTNAVPGNATLLVELELLYAEEVPFTFRDLIVGEGAEAVDGAALSVTYTGWLFHPTAPDNRGEQFDASEEGESFSFTLGAGDVIDGWETGIVGMRVGGRRRLVIPHAAAYGAEGQSPNIPGYATLLFEVELLAVN